MERFINVTEEYYNDCFQVLSYHELDDFSGQYVLRFEALEYQHNEHILAWLLIKGDQKQLNAAHLLAESKGIFSNLRDAYEAINVEI